MQETDQRMRSLQMEGMTQRTWWAATMGHQLLGNLCSSRNMVDHLFLLRLGNHQRMAEPTNRFHIGIYASPTEVPLYMKLPQGYDSKFLPEGAMKGTHVLICYTTSMATKWQDAFGTSTLTEDSRKQDSNQARWTPACTTREE